MKIFNINLNLTYMVNTTFFKASLLQNITLIVCFNITFFKVDDLDQDCRTKGYFIVRLFKNCSYILLVKRLVDCKISCLNVKHTCLP